MCILLEPHHLRDSIFSPGEAPYPMPSFSLTPKTSCFCHMKKNGDFLGPHLCIDLSTSIPVFFPGSIVFFSKKNNLASQFIYCWILRNGNPLQYSCLENPMDRGAWQATVHGAARVRHDLATNPPPP